MTADEDAVTVIAAAAPEAPEESTGDVASTVAFRRSLRVSRTRRVGAALRRRRLLRGRGSFLTATVGLVLLSAAAFAQQSGSGSRSSSSNLSAATIAAAQRALGVEADGIVGPVTRRATREFQRENGLVVDGIIGPQTLKALGIEDDGEAVAVSPELERIAICESGGDPTAVSPDGRYRGKYQFTRETWQQMGGEGDPAAAPEAEQDRRAARLLAEEGASSWPTCG